MARADTGRAGTGRAVGMGRAGTGRAVGMGLGMGMGIRTVTATGRLPPSPGICAR